MRSGWCPYCEADHLHPHDEDIAEGERNGTWSNPCYVFYDWCRCGCIWHEMDGEFYPQECGIGEGEL